MGIFQLDLTIMSMLQLSIEDMRKNPWILQDVMSDCIRNPYLREKYGQKQIDSMVEWFMNNQIDIYMRPRNDKDRLPCITITPGPAPEKLEMKTMADQSVEDVILMPQQIGKPIPFIMKPFIPTGYDIEEGIVSLDETLPGFDAVAPGQVLVDPDNGQGFVILAVDGEGIHVEPGLNIEATRLAVVPKYQFYTARIEHTFTQESAEIGCHSHGDPQVCLWLHSIVLYSIFRYRESLLESNGFAESSISSSPLVENPYYSGPDGEVAYVRSIQLTGQAEQRWIKSPRRTIESVVLKEKEGCDFVGGITILSNLNTPSSFDVANEPWTTVEETDENTDE